MTTKTKPVRPAKPAADSPDRKMLENALGQIEKTFGRGSIMKLSDPLGVPIDGIPTGALSLDLAMGGMGFPRGRIIELFGPESSGKTTLALHVIASAQRGGGIAAFIDAEHALDPAWAKRLGVDLEDLLVSQPSYGEEGLQIAEMLIKSNAVDIIVIDSVAALVPKAELDGEIGDTHVGLQARMMSQAMRKLTGAIAKSKTCVIFINQIREKIGVMFGSPETTPGGRALKFYSSCRVDVRRLSTLKEGETAIGIRMKVKIVKNKIAPPLPAMRIRHARRRGDQPRRRRHRSGDRGPCSRPDRHVALVRRRQARPGTRQGASLPQRESQASRRIDGQDSCRARPGGRRTTLVQRSGARAR